MCAWKFLKNKLSNVIFLAGFAGQGDLNKDHIAWLDGANPADRHVNEPLSKIRPESYHLQLSIW